MANDGIAVVRDGQIVFLNPAFAKMIGYEESELLGKSFESFLDPVASHLYKEKQEQFGFGQRNRPSFRARFIRSDKSIMIADVSTADFAFQGQLALVVLVRDVTHQLQLESLLEQSESRYRMLFESSPIAYFAISARGIIQGMNNAAEKLLGFKSDDLLHRSVSSLLPKATTEIERTKSVLSEALEGRTIKDAEIKLGTSADDDVWVSVSSGLLPMDGQSSTIGLIALDIHQRKTAEERERAQRERANLYLEVTTHDLNNVNQTLLFVMDLMELLPDLSDEMKQLVRQSNWNVRRSARMISNLKRLMSLRDNPPRIGRIDPYHPLQRAVDSVQLDFPWKSINMKSNLGEGMFFLAAHSDLETAFFNIIHISATYDDRESVEVDVTVSRDESSESIRFEFCDRGPGIPDALKESVFKRSGSPDKQSVGRGLGLTLVDAIVEGLGGKVWVEDRVEGHPSQGSRFVVLIPEWTELIIPSCGRPTCITFYKSDHCLFCEQVYSMVIAGMQEFGIPARMVQIVNVDDPNAGIPVRDVPIVPLVRICKEQELTGLVSDDQVRSALLTMVVKSCYPVYWGIRS